MGQIRDEYIAFCGKFSVLMICSLETVGSMTPSTPVLPGNSPTCVQLMLQGEAQFNDKKTTYTVHRQTRYIRLTLEIVEISTQYTNLAGSVNKWNQWGR